MLKSNEVLSLYAILKKANCEELLGITNCVMDEFTLKYAQEHPLPYIPELKEKELFREKHG